ncbi:selenide, water dikinase SelD [Amycolatopsis sp. VS8301801F10]|uniref:selenide, water dikinase SelD n=1 Tax=Amycolatopsis sp. VS8301801F10 TaxID=2652442 RepID=UPI0038FCF84C
MVAASERVRLTELSTGAGCACKLPLEKLDDLFSSFREGLAPASDDLLVGALDGDDAAVLRLDAERALVLTTDFFTPIVDDPYDWGRVAAANALSDVYAMGGRPLIAVNLTAWPGEVLPMTLLNDVLRGGADLAATAQCQVVGGHTIDDAVPKYGMAVLGIAHPERLLAIDRLRPGDHLVLTKPLGTGVITTALKNAAADDAVVRAAVDSMTTLNAAASEVALAAGVRAATDITGFGLAGHLHRMLRASGAAAELDAASVPLLPGALELAARFVPGGTRANTAYLAPTVDVDSDVPHDLAVLLHDAQTSGGLLLAVPDDPAKLIAALAARGIDAPVIGKVVEGQPGRVRIRGGAATR